MSQSPLRTPSPSQSSNVDSQLQIYQHLALPNQSDDRPPYHAESPQSSQYRPSGAEKEWCEHSYGVDDEHETSEPTPALIQERQPNIYSDGRMRHNLATPLSRPFDQSSRYVGAQFGQEDLDTTQGSSVKKPGFIVVDEHQSLILNRDARPAASQILPPPDKQRPSILVHDTLGRVTTPVADEDDRLLVRDSSETPLILSRHVRDRVYAFNEEWMPKMSSIPELRIHCRAVSPLSTYESGVDALQSCFRGALPTTFEAVFAMMHISFAFSSVMHQNDESCYWDAFSVHVLEWYHAISNIAEACLFVRVWNKLWRPPAYAQLILPREHASQSPLTTFSYISSAILRYPTLAAGHPSSDLMDDDAGGVLTDQKSREVFSMLMDGMVIKGCSRFFDSFEHAAMVERVETNPKRDPQKPFIETMQQYITEPLRRCCDTEVFREHIIESEIRLGDGLIRGVRELEVTLINYTKWSQIPPHVHRDFLEGVASRCNAVLRSPNPSWRNEYYIADLEMLRRSTDQLEEYQGIVAYRGHQKSWVSDDDDEDPQIRPNNASATPIGAELAPHASPMPPYAFSGCLESVDLDNVTSDTPTTTLGTSANLPTTDPTAYSVTSPDLLSMNSRSSTRSPSVSSTDVPPTTTICERCHGVEFTGQLQSQRRSLRRHNATVHDIDARLECEFPHCGETFSRDDNRKRHMEQQHGYFSLSEPNINRKRKRPAAPND